ncbi:hypothetical protein LJK88_13370 [Paenibacillus sp. P26]|nr:hypothetical protein LJK88_13370 [Paenibacillus sp. P26]
MLLSPVSVRMVERLSNGRITRIQADPPIFGEESVLPLQDVHMFHATGKLSEVREVLRRIISAQIPLDEVEMIISDAEYAIAISTLCDSMNLPCSFSEGLSLETSRMGRAALSLLNWLESGYHVRSLMSMLQQQQLTFSDREQEISNTDCIRTLEKSGIGWGKERYIKLLEPNRVVPEEYSDETRDGRERTEVQQRDDKIKQHLMNIIKELFPAESAMSSPAGIWGWLVQVLERYGVCGMEEDAIVLQEMKGIFKELQECPVPETMSLEQILLYTRDMLKNIRVGVQPFPKPGSLYISSLANGGSAGESIYSCSGWMNIRGPAVSGKIPCCSMKSADVSAPAFKPPRRDSGIGGASGMCGSASWVATSPSVSRLMIWRTERRQVRPFSFCRYSEECPGSRVRIMRCFSEA